jgi:hypothetical protein
MRRDYGKVGRKSEDIAQGPGLEEVERDIGVKLQQRHERNDALLDLLRAVPVVGLGITRTVVCPPVELLLHRFGCLAYCIVRDVDNDVEKNLGREPKQFVD